MHVLAASPHHVSGLAFLPLTAADMRALHLRA